MIELIKTIFHDGETKRRVIATEPTFGDAIAKANELGVTHLTIDEDYEECADALFNDGSILAIQPVGFKAKDFAEWQKGLALAKERRESLEELDKLFGLAAPTFNRN